MFLLFRENLTMPLGLSKFSTPSAACAEYQPQFFPNTPPHSKVMPQGCGRLLFSKAVPDALTKGDKGYKEQVFEKNKKLLL